MALPTLGTRATLAQPAGEPGRRYHAVIGNVRSGDESRLLGAHVDLTARGLSHPERAGALTGADGAFEFDRVPDGVALLVVRRLGFRPETLSVEVPQPPGGPIVVMLTRIVQLLPAVVVRDAGRHRAAAYGFEHRRAQGFGHFLTRADIERRNPLRTSDLFRSIPGVTMSTTSTGALAPRFRIGGGGRATPCDPGYWLDGLPLGVGAPDLDALPPRTIESIEVYSGNATIPAALRNTTAAGGCGVVAIWTRRGEYRADEVADGVTADSLGAMVARGWAYTADQVELAAMPLPGLGPEPAYPDSLRAAGVRGQAVAEFIVDAQGKVDPETVGILSSTHPLFAAAVREAIGNARFSPAYRQQRVVRQVVHLPVVFEPTSSIPTAR